MNLDQFLRSEREVPLTDIICDSCDKASGCRNCKAARSDSTYKEICEDTIIKKALQVEPISGDGQDAKFKISLE